MTNIKEAYTAVIDFNKTIVSISSTILAALISYLVFQEYDFTIRNFTSPILLVISITFSFFGFGFAIPAINVAQAKIWAVRFSNIGAAVMLLGIISIAFIQKKELNDLDKILHKVETTFKTIDPKINRSNCQSFSLSGETYIFNFTDNKTIKQVTFSTNSQQIVSYKIK